jgi:hypothetical protein
LEKSWDTKGDGYSEREQYTNCRLIVIHIGSKEGFLPGAQLVFKAKRLEITIDKLITKNSLNVSLVKLYVTATGAVNSNANCFLFLL